MKPEEQKILLSEILVASQAGDTALVSEKITALSEDYGTVNAALVLATSKVNELSGKNTALQEQNLKLFLKQGAVVIPDKTDEDEKKKLDFADLFDPETGKLKGVK